MGNRGSKWKRLMIYKPSKETFTALNVQGIDRFHFNPSLSLIVFHNKHLVLSRSTLRFKIKIYRCFPSVKLTQNFKHIPHKLFTKIRCLNTKITIG